MFLIKDDLTICITRGDVGDIIVTPKLRDGTPYTFQAGDVVRFNVFKRKECACVVIRKDVSATENTESVTVSLTSEDTRIGEIINKPVDYWYEVEMNPETKPQTLIGYDEAGEKIFRLYPEGGDIQ